MSGVKRRLSHFLEDQGAICTQEEPTAGLKRLRIAEADNNRAGSDGASSTEQSPSPSHAVAFQQQQHAAQSHHTHHHHGVHAQQQHSSHPHRHHQLQQEQQEPPKDMGKYDYHTMNALLKQLHFERLRRLGMDAEAAAAGAEVAAAAQQQQLLHGPAATYG